MRKKKAGQRINNLYFAKDHTIDMVTLTIGGLLIDMATAAGLMLHVFTLS